MKLGYVAAIAAAGVLGITGCATNNAAGAPLTPAAAQSAVPAPRPARTVYVVPQAPATTTVIVQQPAGHAPGIDNWYPINSQGSNINVRINPSTISTILGTVAQDQYVHIDCTQEGDAVTGPWGTTALWDHIDSPYVGYVSDEWVNTATGAPVVGHC